MITSSNVNKSNNKYLTKKYEINECVIKKISDLSRPFNPIQTYKISLNKALGRQRGLSSTHGDPRFSLVEIKANDLWCS